MTKFCPECGTKQRDENNKYCSNCGFDFSRLEKDSSLNVSNSIIEEDLNMDDSSVDVPIVPLGSEDSKFDSSSKNTAASIDSSISSAEGASSSSTSHSSSAESPNSPITPRSTTKKPSTSSAKVSSASSTKRTRNYSSKSSNSDFLSYLTFNKCFLAFAILFILLVTIGMIGQSTETEPYSDDGLTSFMYESYGYVLYPFLEDYNNYDAFDFDYLCNADYDVYTI